MPTATIELDVTELPDAEEWFVNAAAWSNYWANQHAQVTLDPAATTLYVPSPAVDGDYYDMQVDGANQLVPSQAVFLTLLAAYNNLNTAFQNFRSELKDAGYIDNAQ